MPPLPASTITTSQHCASASSAAATFHHGGTCVCRQSDASNATPSQSTSSRIKASGSMRPNGVVIAFQRNPGASSTPSVTSSPPASKSTSTSAHRAPSCASIRTQHAAVTDTPHPAFAEPNTRMSACRWESPPLPIAVGIAAALSAEPSESTPECGESSKDGMATDGAACAVCVARIDGQFDGKSVIAAKATTYGCLTETKPRNMPILWITSFGISSSPHRSLVTRSALFADGISARGIGDYGPRARPRQTPRHRV